MTFRALGRSHQRSQAGRTRPLAVFQLNSRIPLARISSAFPSRVLGKHGVVHRGRDTGPEGLCPAVTGRQSRVGPPAHVTVGAKKGPASSKRRVLSARPPGHFPRSRPEQGAEPTLVPKLRVRFADFPWLHSSVDQGRLALETGCGVGYGCTPPVDLGQPPRVVLDRPTPCTAP